MVINWERIDELRGEVGPESFDEVVQLFLIEVDEVMARLRASPDGAVGEDDLHFLKGCALNLGFRALSDLCTSTTAAVSGGVVAGTYDKSRDAFLRGVQSGLRAA